MNAVTILPREIEKFNALADTWWDEDGAMWPLHRLNALRVPYIEAQLRQHFKLASDTGLDNLSIVDKYFKPHFPQIAKVS